MVRLVASRTTQVCTCRRWTAPRRAPARSTVRAPRRARGLRRRGWWRRWSPARRVRAPSFRIEAASIAPFRTSPTRLSAGSRGSVAPLHDLLHHLLRALRTRRGTRPATRAARSACRSVVLRRLGNLVRGDTVAAPRPAVLPDAGWPIRRRVLFMAARPYTSRARSRCRATTIQLHSRRLRRTWPNDPAASSFFAFSPEPRPEPAAAVRAGEHADDLVPDLHGLGVEVEAGCRGCGLVLTPGAPAGCARCRCRCGGEAPHAARLDLLRAAHERIWPHGRLVSLAERCGDLARAPLHVRYRATRAPAPQTPPPRADDPECTGPM